MKVTVDERMFRDRFIDYNKEDNFSAEGLSLLFDYLEQLEEDTGEEMELDVIALCCDYSELPLKEFAQEYCLETTYEEPVDVDDDGDTISVTRNLSDEELKEVIEEYISENTTLVGFTSEDTVVFCSAF